MNPKPWEWTVEFRVKIDFTYKTNEKEKRFLLIDISSHDMVEIRGCSEIEGKTDLAYLHYRHYQNAIRLTDTLFRISYTQDPIEKLMIALDKIRYINYQLESGSGSRQLKIDDLKEKEFMDIVLNICGKRKEIADHPPIVYPVGTLVKILNTDQALVAKYREAISKEKLDPEGDSFDAKRLRALTVIVGQILPVSGHVIDTHSHYVMFQDECIHLRPEDIEPVEE